MVTVSATMRHLCYCFTGNTPKIGEFVFHYVSGRIDFYVFVNAISVHYIHCERRTIARSKVSKPLLTGGHGVA